MAAVDASNEIPFYLVLPSPETPSWTETVNILKALDVQLQQTQQAFQVLPCFNDIGYTKAYNAVKADLEAHLPAESCQERMDALWAIMRQTTPIHSEEVDSPYIADSSRKLMAGTLIICEYSSGMYRGTSDQRERFSRLLQEVQSYSQDNYQREERARLRGMMIGAGTSEIEDYEDEGVNGMLTDYLRGYRTTRPEVNNIHRVVEFEHKGRSGRALVANVLLPFNDTEPGPVIYMLREPDGKEFMAVSSEIQMVVLDEEWDEDLGSGAYAEAEGFGTLGTLTF